MNARLIFHSILFGLFLLFPLVSHASVFLSEVQVGGDKAADEFVELYNPESELINLKDYSLRRKSQSDVTAKGSSLKTFGSSDTIPAHGYFLWASSAGIFKDLADTTTGGGLSDNNSLGLFDTGGNLIDSLTWGTGHVLPFAPTQFDNPEKKESLVRDLSTLAWSKTKSSSPTNSKGETWKEETPPPPEPKPLVQIVINEVFPNPDTKGDLGEFIEFYNPLSETIDLSLWEIHDASASGKYVFPSGAVIESQSYLVLTDQEFTFALNNTNETLTLFDNAKRVVHSVHYDKTKEGITLNLVGEKLRGGKIPTPGKANSLNSDPVIKEKVPKKGFVHIAVAFQAKGKDIDGDKLKYTWDFGDNHKSYKATTTHKYQKTGVYTVVLTTDDGTDTTSETFPLKIEKYEAPKLRIVALMPNPKGKDSDLEWIEIENLEKKKVDLLGFGIATGAKKKSLVNHPIRNDITIGAKSTKRLTREDALFTFNNKQGLVELRAPNGDRIASVKYAFDKSLPDNAVLYKEKGKSLRMEIVKNETESEDQSLPEEEAAEAAPSTAELVTTESTSEGHDSLLPEVKGDFVNLEENTSVSLPTAPLPTKRAWYDRLNEWLNAWLNWN